MNKLIVSLMVGAGAIATSSCSDEQARAQSAQMAQGQFEGVQVGMTRQQVDQIVGAASSNNTTEELVSDIQAEGFPRLESFNTTYTLGDGTKMIVLFTNGEVQMKTRLP